MMVDHIHSLIASFKDQISTAFLDYEQVRSNRPRVSMVPVSGVRSRHRGKNGMTSVVQTKLTQLVDLVSDLTTDMSALVQSHSAMEDPGSEDDSRLVCRKGPPGAEPRINLPVDEGELKDTSEEEPIVHQRNSTNITLSPFLSPRRLKLVKMKDNQPSKCVVYLEPPKETCSTSRYTRSKGRACMSGSLTGRFSYREESTDSWDSDEEDQLSSADEFRVDLDEDLQATSGTTFSTKWPSNGDLSSSEDEWCAGLVPAPASPRPNRHNSILQGLDSSNSLYQTTKEWSHHESRTKNGEAASPASSVIGLVSPISIPYKKNQEASPTSRHCPSSPIAYDTPSPMVSESASLVGQPGESIEETPHASPTSPRIPSEERQSTEPIPSPFLAVSYSSSPPSLPRGDSVPVESDKSLPPSPTHASSPLLSNDETPGSSPPPNSDSTALPGSKSQLSSHKASGIRRVLSDIQESFISMRTRSGTAGRQLGTVKRELRLNQKRPESPAPQPAVLYFKQKPVVVLEKLPLDTVKSSLVHHNSEDSLSQHDSSESHRSWKNYEEELLSSTSAEPLEEPNGNPPCEVAEESKGPLSDDSQRKSGSSSPNFLFGPASKQSSASSLPGSKLSLRSRSHSVASSWEEEFEKPKKPVMSSADTKPLIGLKSKKRHRPLSLERKPFVISVLSNSEDDFDMISSQPPSFSKTTPSRRTRPLSASSMKRKKILRSVSDDEEDNIMSKNLVKTEPLVSPVVKKEDSPVSRHTQSSRLAEAAGPADTNSPSSGSSLSHPNDDTEEPIPPGGAGEASSGERLDTEGKLKVALPWTVHCAACGKHRVWRMKPLYKHPRMDVLVCLECLRLITSGEFTVSGGHEEYCSLCGDGGEIFMCQSCIRSFCVACIRRVSGEEYLRKLLESENEELTCYCCDPAPLAKYTEVCNKLIAAPDSLNHQASNVKKHKKSTKRGANSRKTTANSNSSNSNSKSVKVERSSPQPSKPPGRSSNVATRRRDQSSDSSNSVFTNDSSSEESLKVNTDDVSLSDSSELDESGAKKEQRERRELKRARKSSGSGGSDHKGKSDRRTSGKKRRVLPRLLGSEYEHKNVSSKDSGGRVGKKRLVSSGSSESLTTTTRTKRSKLAVMLSSESESEVVSKLTVSIPENAGDEHCLFLPSTPDKPFKPLTYLTPRVNISSDSSDNDETVVQKPRRRRKVKKLPSTSSQSDEASPEARRKSSKAQEGDSADEFADLSRTGPRLKKRVVRRLMLSDVSDSDESLEAVKNESDTDENKSSPAKQTTPGKKRKEIRKVIDNSKLDERTKLALARENERRERLKKKKTNSLSEGEKLILEEDVASKEPVVQVRSSITSSIKPHQKEGIKFLYDACVESLERFKSGQRNGAILAHCMGLGKSLQLLAFVDALLTCEDSGVKTVLILTPINTLYNWRNEVERWIPDYMNDYGVYLMNVTGVKNRLRRLKRWQHYGGIMFIGYEMFRSLASGKVKNCSRKNKEELAKCLLDPGADIIVCDEGHVMRNSKSGLSVILGRVKTTCRIVLTGTPLQNNLLEYFTMVNFVKPNLLGTQKEFKNQFVNPIKNGQCSDSKPSDIRTMKQRAHVLHSVVEGCVQRRDFRVLSEALPPKYEYVISFHLTDIQDKLYRLYLEQFRSYGAKDLFSTFSNLAKVWNHPWVLRLSEERRRLNAVSDDEDEDTSLDGFIVFGSDEEAPKKKKKHKRRNVRGSSTSSSNSHAQPHPSCIEPIVISSDSDFSFPAEVVVKSEPGVAQLHVPSNGTTLNEGMPEPAPAPTDQAGPSGTMAGAVGDTKKYVNWYNSLLTEDLQAKLEASGKLVFLMELLDKADLQREKVIVFSQSLLTLDLIERFLDDCGDWTPGLDYYRLDGSTSADVRQANMTEFNDTTNSRIRLFLISTRAGSLGVNLVAANRVVIFDACWNPSHDLQAIFRTYRFGQTKSVYVYRLLAQGTMEEKIYDRQVTKQSLSMRVVDHKQIGRHYTASDLAELFTYSPKPPTEPPYKRPTEDRTLCSILDKLEPQFICGYHEHDSLLEHIYDEELSEAEKKAAWENYKQQTANEAQRSYNYDALNNRLEEVQERAKPHVEMVTVGVNPSSSGPSTQHPNMPPYAEAIHFLDISISKCRELIVRQQMNRGVLSKLSVEQIGPDALRQVINGVVTKENQLKVEIQKLLGYTNEAIRRFNHSSYSQIPRLNQEVRKKRAILQEVHNQIMRISNMTASIAVGAPLDQPRAISHPASSDQPRAIISHPASSDQPRAISHPASSDQPRAIISHPASSDLPRASSGAHPSNGPSVATTNNNFVSSTTN